MLCSAGFLLLSVAFLIIERNVILILFLLTLYLLEHYELFKEMRFHFLYQRLLHGPDDELDVKLVAASRLLHLHVLSLPSLPEI